MWIATTTLSLLRSVSGVHLMTSHRARSHTVTAESTPPPFTRSTPTRLSSYWTSTIYTVNLLDDVALDAVGGRFAATAAKLSQVGVLKWSNGWSSLLAYWYPATYPTLYYCSGIANKGTIRSGTWSQILDSERFRHDASTVPRVVNSLSTTVACLSHWPSTFVYNAMGVKRRAVSSASAELI